MKAMIAAFIVCGLITAGAPQVLRMVYPINALDDAVRLGDAAQ